MVDFKTFINSEKPVLVDFSLECCGCCKMMVPILDRLKKLIGDKATIINVDIDKNSASASTYHVKVVPTIVLFKNGEVKWRQSGVVPADYLQKIIENNI